MGDRFLELDRVQTEGDAMTKSFAGALQRNPTYRKGVSERKKKEFRAEWAKLIRQESQRYVQPAQPILDDQHCAAIRSISKRLSDNFADILRDGRLRFGTSQKALNLYLKYLWRLGNVEAPPTARLTATCSIKEGWGRGRSAMTRNSTWDGSTPLGSVLRRAPCKTGDMTPGCKALSRNGQSHNLVHASTTSTSLALYVRGFW
jgi:hypothetical protein